jgi:hypothetical protein
MPSVAVDTLPRGSLERGIRPCSDPGVCIWPDVRAVDRPEGRLDGEPAGICNAAFCRVADGAIA